MKTFRPFPIAVLLTVAVPLAVVGCSKSGADLQQTSTAQALGPQKVKAATVELRDYAPTLESTGTLVPRRQATLKALVDGRLDALGVDIGSRVGRGAVLFQARLSDFTIARDQAEAALARAQVALKDREREMARMEGLFKEGSATEQMRDMAVTAREDAAAGLKEAEARAASARQTLEDATVTAPYAGVITARFHQRGEFVSRGNDVLEIMDLSVLDARMEIPEPYAGEVAPGMPVAIALRAGGRRVEGRVVAVNPKVDAATRTFQVKVEVDNRDGGLQAGLFCTGIFTLRERAGRPAVPTSALIRDEGRSTVWVLEEGKAKARRVVEAGRDDGWVYIEDGLEGGEQVVVEGHGGLHDGAEVAVEG